MRKHLLWYVKGWPGAKKLREQLSHIESLEDAGALIDAFAAGITALGETLRLPVTHEQQEGRFVWDPKYEMDRKLDRGVGDELMSP